MGNFLQRGVFALVIAGLGSVSVDAAELAVPCQETASASLNADDAAQNRWRYPFEAKRQRAQGTVKMQVHLDQTGAATTVKLAHSSGSSALDRAALKAARTARFCQFASPAQAMSGIAEVSVSYSLNAVVAKL